MRAGLPHHEVVAELDAELPEVLDLAVDDLLREPELRDPVDEHPARTVQGLEHGDRVAQADEVAGHGEPRGAGADDRRRASPWAAAISGTSKPPFSRSQSATKRSSLPMLTDFSVDLSAVVTAHTIWHWSSCGHTRPQMAGRRLRSRTVATAPWKSPSATWRTKRGMSIPTGQPEMHLAFGHSQAAGRLLDRLHRGEAERHLRHVADALVGRLLGHDLLRQLEALLLADSRRLLGSCPGCSSGALLGRARRVAKRGHLGFEPAAVARPILLVAAALHLGVHRLPAHHADRSPPRGRRTRARPRRRTASCLRQRRGSRRTSRCRRS